MSTYAGQFPLKLVVFPGETLSLHIFEPRYKDLIRDCVDHKMIIGIPTIIKSQGLLAGTTLTHIDINHVYKDGKMDITVQGGDVYNIIRFDDPMQGKRYAGAEIKFKPFDANQEFLTNQKIVEKVNLLYRIMGIKKSVEQENLALHPFIHKIGLSIRQEFQILRMESGKEQQEFVLDHLTHLLPIVKEMEKMKKRIKMNGHFKQPINPNLNQD